MNIKGRRLIPIQDGFVKSKPIISLFNSALRLLNDEIVGFFM